MSEVMKQETVVDMAHFDVDGAMEQLAQKRFAMPPAVIAAFRQAAMKSAFHLLNMVESDGFHKLRIQDQMRVMEMIFDRAYGKSETLSSAAVAEAKTGATQNDSHTAQLDAITARLAKRRGMTISHTDAHTDQAQSGDGAPDVHSADVASLDVFPELRKRHAANVVRLPKRPL